MIKFFSIQYAFIPEVRFPFSYDFKGEKGQIEKGPVHPAALARIFITGLTFSWVQENGGKVLLLVFE